MTSNIRNMIQGLGRIDRIDGPHSELAYWTVIVGDAPLEFEVVPRTYLSTEDSR